MGVMVAVSAILVVGQLGSAQPTAGHGARPRRHHRRRHRRHPPDGRRGSLGRTALGVAFISILNSGLLNLGSADAYYQLYRGIALLSVLTVQVIVRRLTDVEERRLRTREQLAALTA